MDGLHRKFSPLTVWPLGTIDRRTTAMNIRRGRQRSFADIGEAGPEVALRAVNFFGHSAKRLSRGVVIEFWDRAIGPSCARVTGFAGMQGVMRTPAGLLL